MLRIAKFHILLLITCIFFVPLNPLAALAQGSNAHVVVNTFRLNVRTGPGVSHGIITDLPGGTELPVTMLSVDRKWYEVTGDFGMGWLHSAYAVARGDFSTVPWAGAPSNIAGSTDDVASSAARLVINTAYLNVRTGPGVGHSILTTLRGGTEVAVLARDHGGVWYQVATSAGTGWVNTRYTVGRGDFSAVPTLGGQERVEEPGIAAGTPHLVVNTSYLNIRTGPGARHDILTTVPGGTKLAAIGIAPDRVWYEVVSSAGNGWVHTNYTVGRGDFSGVKRYEDALSGDTPRALVNTSRLNIRTGPSAGHGIVTSVPGGTTLAVLGKSADGKWLLVEGGFGQGWLRNLYVAFRGDYSLVQLAG